MLKKLFGFKKKDDNEKIEKEEKIEQVIDQLKEDNITINKTETEDIKLDENIVEYVEDSQRQQPVVLEDLQVPSDSSILNDENSEVTDEDLAKEPTLDEREMVVNTEVAINSSIEQVKVEEPKKLGLFERLKSGLNKTRNAVSSSIDNLVNGKAKIDEDLYDELEEILISADMGVDTTVSVIDQLRDHIEENHIRDPKQIKSELVTLLKEKLLSTNINNELNFESGKPLVILVIGVNGVGKTTTIGKLAHNIMKEGKTVTLCAADTFRAAAIQQLTEWANRARVEIISHEEGSDPASVVFDAIKSHKSKGKDVLIIDTAGRLHNKVNLMNELEKINRIIEKNYPESSRETLLVLDATTGQNAIYQAKEFNKVANISGLVLTKLDGTAKGGVVFPLQVENSIPVKYIGIGEGIDNLEKFDSEKFVDAMFS